MGDKNRINITFPAGVLKQLLDTLDLNISSRDGIAADPNPAGSTGDLQMLVSTGDALLPRRARRAAKNAAAPVDPGCVSSLAADLVSLGDSLIPRRARK